MLKMVDGTGIIGVDMICPLGVSAPQPPNYDRVELEGTGILVLPNSLDAPLDRLELGGKTAQMSTEGYNCWNPYAYNNLASGPNIPDTIEFIDNAIIYKKNDGTRNQMSINIPFGKLKIGTYKITFSNLLCKLSSNGAKEKGVFASTMINKNGDKIGNTITFAVDDEEAEYSFSCSVISEVSSFVSMLEVIVQNPMLALETKTTYEPYTGGKPSPSQEYQQEVKNSGKWNEGTQKYEVDVKVTNAEQNWNKEQTLTLTSDRPITKWDRLVEQGGEIGWLYKSKVYDGFDGKNNRIELGNKVGNVQHFSVYFASTPNSVGNANSYCDKYIGVNVSWTKEKFGIFCDWNNGVKIFSAPNEKVTNLEEFKAWLIENPLGLAYETLETEFIPLPQSEQNAIRALKTYYPTTVITADGGELDPDIKVTYRKEI